MKCPRCNRTAEACDGGGWRCDSCRFSFGVYYAYLWRKYRPLRARIRAVGKQGRAGEEDALRRMQRHLDKKYPDLPCIRLPQSGLVSPPV
jgi:hypothetical protein